LLAAAALVSVLAPSAAGGAPMKRPVPNYDGRAEADATAGDALLWIPRVLLSPAYLVSEYVLRRPLGYLFTEAERAEVPSLLLSIFTFDEGKAGIIPTVLFDFGLDAGALPSAGFYFFYDDLAFAGHDLRARAAIGGSDWVELDLTNRFALDAASRLSVGLSYERRKDEVFAGVGPSFDDDAIGRYGLDRLSARVGVERTLGLRGEVSAFLALSHYGYFRGDCCDEPGLDERVEQGVYPTPAGFDDRHTDVGPTVRLALDSRPVRPGPESGVRLELFGVAARGLDDTDATWLRYGASLGGYLDFHNNRTVGLRVYAEFVSAIDGDAPFSELALLGGKAPLRAFEEGRLRGESALALTLDYRWPIWVFLDGSLFVEVGNVFGAALEGLESDRLRLSFGLGMRPASREDHPFEFLLAFGTEPLGDGAEITTLRVVFGTTTGF
jgi:hypothetical protein